MELVSNGNKPVLSVLFQKMHKTPLLDSDGNYILPGSSFPLKALFSVPFFMDTHDTTHDTQHQFSHTSHDTPPHFAARATFYS